jgi:hypothetical protein
MRDALSSGSGRRPLALVTLDVMDALYADIGLSAGDHRAFRHAVREACSGTPEGLADWSTIPERWEQAFARVAAQLGAEAGRVFRIWAEDVAFSEWTYGGSWQIYDSFFGNSRVNMHRTGENRLATIEAGAGLLRLYDMMSFSADARVRRVLNDVKRTRWDAAVMEICQWKVEEQREGDPDRFSLEDIIEAYVSLNRFQIFWRFAMSLLSNSDRDQLWGLVKEHQRSLPTIDPFPPPSAPLHPARLQRRLPI